jgi:hypothetical protein
VNVEPCWVFEIVPTQMQTWQGFDWATRYKHPEFYPDDATGRPPVQPRDPA